MSTDQKSKQNKPVQHHKGKVKHAKKQKKRTDELLVVLWSTIKHKKEQVLEVIFVIDYKVKFIEAPKKY